MTSPVRQKGGAPKVRDHCLQGRGTLRLPVP